MLDLRQLVLGLRYVGVAPAVVAAADIFRAVDHRAAVDPELFERFVEDVGIDPQRAAARTSLGSGWPEACRRCLRER